MLSNPNRLVTERAVEVAALPDEGHWIFKPQNNLLWYHAVLDWIGEWTKK